MAVYPEEYGAAGAVFGGDEGRVTAVLQRFADAVGVGRLQDPQGDSLRGRANGVVLQEGVDVFALDEHAWWGRHGGLEGRGGVGGGEGVEVQDVVLVGAGVGRVGEDEEVVALGLEGFWIAGGDHWMVALSLVRGAGK